MTFGDGSKRVLLRGLLIVTVAALVGVIAGHFVWSASPTLRLAPATNRSFRPFEGGGSGLGSGASERSGESGGRARSGGSQYEYGGGLFGEPGETGGRATEPGGSGEHGGSGESGSASESGGLGEGGGGSGEGGSSSGVSSSITSKVDPALVDINTVLGLEGAEAAGTGMVVTSQGEVITNNHVIAGASKITATDIGNGTTYTARVVGYDHNHDIAVLQLEGASGLKTVSFADASSLRVGEGVATIGNAGGAGGAPSAAGGQVAALDQSITAGDDLDGTQEQLSGLIQLSGDLQPGDSGGPLVNSAGEVVGMDTAASATYQFESSADEGFAIPINDVETIANQIREGQSSSTVHIGATGMLGVFIQSQGSDGARVEDVISETPAASSGLAAGDVITAVDGTRVSSPTDLTDLLLEKHPGDSVTITWQTPEGARQTATLTLAGGPPQ